MSDLIEDIEEIQDIDEKTIDIQQYDAVGLSELQLLLRARLQAIKNKEVKGSLRKIGRDIQVSHTYLAEFRDGKPICMSIMNRLANHFNLRYFVENFNDDDAGWR